MKIFRQLVLGRFEDNDFIAYWPISRVRFVTVRYRDITANNRFNNMLDKSLAYFVAFISALCILTMTTTLIGGKAVPPTSSIPANIFLLILFYLCLFWVLISSLRMLKAMGTTKR